MRAREIYNHIPATKELCTTHIVLSAGRSFVRTHIIQEMTFIRTHIIRNASIARVDVDVAVARAQENPCYCRRISLTALLLVGLFQLRARDSWVAIHTYHLASSQTISYNYKVIGIC
jgi:hypothetical protein